MVRLQINRQRLLKFKFNKNLIYDWTWELLNQWHDVDTFYYEFMLYSETHSLRIRTFRISRLSKEIRDITPDRMARVLIGTEMYKIHKGIG